MPNIEKMEGLVNKELHIFYVLDTSGSMKGAPIAERRNFAQRNVFVNPTMDPTGTWDLDDTNLTLDHDPGFVDFQGGDLNLREDSEVFKKIPGFEKIPFSEMGPKH